MSDLVDRPSQFYLNTLTKNTQRYNAGHEAENERLRERCRKMPSDTGPCHHTERIRCPGCGCVQDATVDHTLPYWSYMHVCECGYTIIESEWTREEKP